MVESATLYRSFRLQRDKIDKENRTVPIAFSSEEPGEQWFGMEVLDHASGACMLERLNSNGPLLKDHNPNNQTGVVVEGSAKIDADKIGRCLVRFSKSAEGEKEFQDVIDGIRTSISCGYQIHELRFESEKNGMETYRATKWEPYEVSLVSIPMDFKKSGIARNAETQKNEIEIIADKPEKLLLRKHFMKHILLDPNPAEGGGGAPVATAPAPAPAPAAPAIVRSFAEIRAAEFQRQQNIDEWMNRFADRTEITTYLRENRYKDIELGTMQTEVMKRITAPAPLNTPDLGGGNQQLWRSIGEAFVKSAEYIKEGQRKGTRRSVSIEIALPDMGNFLNGAPMIAARNMILNRATGTTTGLTSIEKLPGIVELGVQMPRVADLMPQTGTDATTIRYIQENSLTNAAAAVAEEGLFPEASWDIGEVDAPVRKIGVLGRVTEETFADYSQLQGYVNGRLRYMLDIKEDSELLNGTGAANRIKGLLQFAGIQTQAMGADLAPDAVLKGKTKVLSVGFFNPDAIVMNPFDWGNFQLMKDKNGQYIFGGPGNVGAYGAGGVMMSNLWRLPIIESTSVAQGTALIGAFRLGAAIFRKLVIVIETTNSDGDDFKYGRIAVRAETRLTLACYRPLAFCQVTGLA